MDEGRRFLRYVMPGLVFLIETVLGLWFVLPDWTISHITPLFTEKDSLGVALGGILASGVLGYIFATTHHWCHWKLWFDKNVFNNSKLAAMLDKKFSSTEFSNDSTKRMVALQITSAYWLKMVKKEYPIGNADENIRHLGDLAHGAGAARVASFAALMTVGTIAYNSGEIGEMWRWISMVVAGCILILLFDNGYRRVAKIAQGIFERIVEEEFKKPV